MSEVPSPFLPVNDTEKESIYARQPRLSPEQFCELQDIELDIGAAVEGVVSSAMEYGLELQVIEYLKDAISRLEGNPTRVL